jgi:hypothetical protein
MKKKICIHEKKMSKSDILFRCACGNVWLGGKFFGSIPKDQGAVAILGSFSTDPAKKEK